MTGFGEVKVATVLLDRITHHCEIMDIGNDLFRFKQRKKEGRQVTVVSTVTSQCPIVAKIRVP
nr:ATP-binding protein [Iodobacter fluviatilis]